jgi:hypothetical protein
MPLNINPFESNPGWDFIKTIYSYYGLKDYVEFLYYDRFNNEKIREIEAYDFDNKQGDKLFWKDVMAGEIIRGDKVRLKNFQISPWFPRKAGLFWTYDAAVARDKAYRYHREKIEKGGFVYDVYGKTLMTELGGIGAVNFRKDRDFVLATATASGYTQEGIPIICRQNVWSEIEKEFQKGNRIEVDLQGTVVNINRDNDSYFLRSSSLPKIAIHINSLLNIQIKASRLDINVTPWTIFETKDRWNPYGFTYINHVLFHDDIENSKKWIEDYVEDHEGKTVLTDFDENINYLKAIFPLNDVTNGSILSKEIIKFSQKIYKDFEREMH